MILFFDSVLFPQKAIKGTMVKNTGSRARRRLRYNQASIMPSQLYQLKVITVHSLYEINESRVQNQSDREITYSTLRGGHCAFTETDPDSPPKSHDSRSSAQSGSRINQYRLKPRSSRQLKEHRLKSPPKFDIKSLLYPAATPKPTCGGRSTAGNGVPGQETPDRVNQSTPRAESAARDGIEWGLGIGCGGITLAGGSSRRGWLLAAFVLRSPLLPLRRARRRGFGLSFSANTQPLPSFPL